MTGHPRAAQFLSCDWGTSAFRLHLVEAASGKSQTSVTSADGINATYQAWRTAGQGVDREQFFFAVVRDQIAKLAVVAGRSLKGLPLVISGMASASIGLRELPHQPTPFSLDGSDLGVERFFLGSDDSGPVLLVSGVRTPADFMRGEEIQVVGAAALGAARDACYLLPGTHSKHVSVRRGQAVDLRTYMTGEFFDLLARRSILVNSVEAVAADTAMDPDVFFMEGVTAGAAGNLLHTSFRVRVEELSGRRSRTAGFQFLSGLVIGTELKELRERTSQTMVMVGNDWLAARYIKALRALGHTGVITAFAADAAVIAGQGLIARRAGLLA